MVSGGTGRGAPLGDFAGIQTVLTRAMHDVLTADASGDTRFRQATGEAQRQRTGHWISAPEVHLHYRLSFGARRESGQQRAAQRTGRGAIEVSA